MNNEYSSIRLEITSKCNLNCMYCHNKEYNNKNDDMTTLEILQLITKLKEVYGINKVLLTGGEPTLNKDLYRIIENLTSQNIKVDMVTNGLLLTPNMIEKLETSGLKRIRISIDEIGKTTANRDCLPPNLLWKKAKMVSDKSNVELCIHTVCSPTNVDSLFEVYKKVLKTGAKRWRVFDIGYQGGVIYDSEKFDFYKYYDKLIKSTQKIIKHYLENNLINDLDIEINNVFKSSFLKEKPQTNFNLNHIYKKRINKSPCDYVSNHQLTIRSYGKATLCQYFHNPIYDFSKWDFDLNKSLINKNYCVENEIKIKDLDYCFKCKYVLNCSGGCRSTAKVLTGNILDADPSACYLHPLVYKNIINILPQNVIETYEQYLNPEGLEPKYNKKDYEQFIKLKGFINEKRAN